MNRQSFLEKAYGCLMGVACGDAMGMPTSFLTPEEIRSLFGKIEEFVDAPAGHRYHAGLKRGQVTDDTEQTVHLAKAILRVQRVDPGVVADELLQWLQEIGGLESNKVGPSSRVALGRLLRGEPVELAGKDGYTNGAAMRIAPVGIINGGMFDECQLLEDVVNACLPTHGTGVAISGAAAVAFAISACFEEGCCIRSIVDRAVAGAVLGRSRGFPYPAASVAARINLALRIIESDLESRAITDIYEVIGSGEYTTEAVPAAIAIFALAGGDPQNAILMAANLGGDCDTVGAIAGAIAGAYAGIKAFPPQWIEIVEEVNKLRLADIAEGLTNLAWQRRSSETLGDNGSRGYI
ncbi:ADP-ribosylglycohydrolase family protein [Moorellaceae bacterium AZ2]